MTHSLLRQVKASAGSGKTHALTGRFLEHLAKAAARPHAPSCSLSHGAGWGDILAITFTNSAAAEMKERVLRRLKETALGDATRDGISPALAKAWVDIILRQYGALNIRTIDSLLHLVVRTAALDLGLPPDFETTFATDETLAPIFDSLLEKAWQGDVRLQGLLRAVCRSLLFHAEAKGFMAGERILSALRPLLELALSSQVAELSPLAQVEERYSALLHEFIMRAQTVLQHVDTEELKSKKNVRETFERCAAGQTHAVESAWLNKATLEECLLKASHGHASDAALRAYVQLAECAEVLRGNGFILKKALELAPFVDLATEIAAGLEEFQQAEGKVPGTIMPRLAKEVLELQHGVPAALCRLGSSCNHILMDEFQDTSREQWEALRPLAGEALSRGGSLTWVGDIKQAIYGWRGGDATLFDEIGHKSQLPMATGLTTEVLPTNWRSREVIVHSNNKLFAPLEDSEICRQVLEAMLARDCPVSVLDEAAPRLAATFAAAAQQVREKGAEGGCFTLTEVQADVKEALSLAVKAELEARLRHDLEGRRPWGDITILVRSNAAAAEVAGWLMEWHIPVITENSLLLASHPLVAESLALLSFLDSAEDDLAFWTVLTGKILAPCLAPSDNEHVESGIPTLEQLRHWALQRRPGYMCMAFKEDWPLFWQRCFAPFHGKAGLMSPYDILQEWYRLLRVPQRFPEARTFLRRLLEVVHTAGEKGSATLSTFLEYWQANNGDEKAPMPTGMDAVRVMTIHKSKGLQFPVVIVPWMSFAQKMDGPPVPFEVDGLRVLAPRCKEMGHIHHMAQAQNALEAINLLYVACTRAEDELHLFHTHTPYLLRMRNLACGLEVLLPAARMTVPTSEGKPTVVPHTPALKGKDSSATEGAASAACPACPAGSEDVPSFPILHAEDEQWRPMHWLPRLKIYRNPLQEMTFTPRRRGMLTHHCLEQLRATGAPLKDAEHAVALGLRTFPLPVPHSEALREELIKALAWFAGLPGAQEWINQGLPEQSLLDTAGKMHRVDLLLPPAEGRPEWRAIDYKTGGQDEEHILQIQRYLALLNCLPERKTASTSTQARGLLIYLDLQGCRMVDEAGISDLMPAPLWCEGGHA